MQTTELTVRTELASRYLQALCKHFRHKVPAEFDAGKGFVDFPFGKCHMTAENEVLHIRCETPGEAEEGRIKDVIEDHLKRFAFRENLDLTWHRTDAG